MDNYTFFIIYVLAVFIAVFVFIVFLARKTILRKGLINRSLNLQLLSVRFVEYPAEDMNLQQIREKIALMEQLYANLAALHESWWRTILYGKPVFALELTVPHIGEELSFFIAVPRALKGTVEKIINGVFPDAAVEESRDYNIFNPEGVAVGASVVLKENRYAPVKTYQRLESDSMRELANVFTKLAKEGEGASMQIVATPADKTWYARLRREARVLYGTEKKGNVFGSVVDVIDEIIGSSPSAGEQKKEDAPKKLTPLEEERAKHMDAKAGKTLFEANVRLLASAPTRERALEILKGFEFSFGQFTDPSANRFDLVSAEKKALKELIFNFSFRGFDESKAMILSSEELTSIFHFPNVSTAAPKLSKVRAREAPPPVNLPTEGMLLGYNVYRGEKRDVYIMDEDRRRHLYAIGQTGTGKSVFLENMIAQDINAGKGICVIDLHGELIAKILQFIPRHRAQEVVYFNPGDIERPMGLNMLEYNPMYPEQKTLIVNELLAIFNKLFNMEIAGGPVFEQYFRNAAMLVMDDPASGNTILDIERVLADKTFRDLKLSRCKNIVVKNFWTQIAEKAGGEASLKDMVPYIASKIDNFITNEILRPIIMQEKSSLDFREIMDSGKILLVNLSKGRLGDLNASFIGLILVGKLLMAALSRADMGEERRKDFYLYIDEFQNVTTDSIATILSEARKYRLNLIITHQFIGQLKEEIKKAVFGNVGSMVSFRIGSDDAEFMAKQYKPVFGEQDLLNIDNFNCYVKLLIRGQIVSPFSMKTHPSGKGDREIAEVVKEISRIKYGRPREEIEKEIEAKHKI